MVFENDEKGKRTVRCFLFCVFFFEKKEDKSLRLLSSIFRCHSYC